MNGFAIPGNPLVHTDVYYLNGNYNNFNTLCIVVIQTYLPQKISKIYLRGDTMRPWQGRR